MPITNVKRVREETSETVTATPISLVPPIKESVMGKRVSLSLWQVIAILLIVVAGVGGYYGYKTLVQKERVTIIASILADIGKKVAPVEGKCQIVTIQYVENGQTKTENVVNMACVNQGNATPTTQPNPFETPAPEPVPVPEPTPVPVP